MPQPTPYSPSVDFSNEEANNVGGRSTVRTAPLDAELSAIAATLQGVLANLALNQRDDGEIRDQRVKLHTLSQDVRALLTAGNVTAENVRGAWVTAAVYVKLDLVSQGGNTYICAAAHTAGTFATDLAAGRWLLVALGAATAASAVPFTATATIAATNVQSAIEEADTENRALNALLRSDLSDKVSASKGAGAVGLNPSLNYVAQTLGAEAIDRGPSLMAFVTDQAERARIKAGTSAADHSSLFAGALLVCKRLHVPAGSWRLFSTVDVPVSAHIYGHGFATSVTAFGCDAFRIAPGNGLCTIEGLVISSATALGTFDPRLYVAVLCNGSSGNTVNFVTVRNLYLQGWSSGVVWNYTWNSIVDNVTTINCNNGIYLFGQSVNNFVSNSRLSANGGNASVWLVNDGPTVGEGLSISNTLMASGVYGVLTGTGFLSLNITNCIIDLVTGDAIRATDCRDLRVSNSWLYATNCCVRLQALGVAAEQGVSLVGNGMVVTSSTGRVIEQNFGNVGLAVIGNQLTFGGTAQGVWLDGQSASVDGNHFANTGSGTSIILNTAPTTHRVGKNTGNATVAFGFATPEYSEGDWTPTDASGAALTFTQNVQAHYVKNGKQVTCSLDITYPATADTSVARITLPFAPEAGKAAPAGSVGYQDINGVFMPGGTPGAANFRLWKPGATGSFATNANLSGCRFQITFTYRAAS